MEKSSNSSIPITTNSNRRWFITIINLITKPRWFKKYWWKKYFGNPLFWIPLLIVTVSTIFYFVKFHGAFSKKNEDWGSFGSYMQMLFSFLNLILFGFLTIQIYEYSKISDVHKRVDERRFRMPIIGFYRWDSPDMYFMKNIGKGAAFNVLVKVMHNDTNWENGRKYHTIISESQEFTLNYTANTRIICATYENLFGDKFLSFMENDILRIIDLADGNHLEKFQEEIRIANEPVKEIYAVVF